jgi:predicted dehydrogenase
MSERLGIGVIGIGFGQHAHVPAFRADPRCEVRAICASSLSRAQEVAQKLAVPKAYGDALELIRDPQIHAVSIALPPSLQPQLIKLAAQAGKHVFCEKPVGLTPQDATEAYEAVRAAGVVSAVNFIFPESPAWEEARRVLQSGQLGAIRHIAISWRVETRAYQGAISAPGWKTNEEQGGGTLRNLVSHSAYYIEWLFGGVSRLNCKLRGLEHSPVDAGVNAWLAIQSGDCINLAVDADSFLGSGHRIEVYGDRGTLVLKNETSDYMNGFELFTGSREQGKLVQRVGPTVSTTDGRITATAKIARRFLDAIQDKSAAIPNLEHGQRVQFLLAAMRQSHETGQWVNT